MPMSNVQLQLFFCIDSVQASIMNNRVELFRGATPTGKPYEASTIGVGINFCGTTEVAADFFFCYPLVK